MDTERNQAVLYVTQYNFLSSNVDGLRENLIFYGIFGYIVLMTGRMGRSYVCASILTAYVVLYALVTTVMRRRMTQVSYFQGALFDGLGSGLLSLYITCVGLVYVEIARLGPGYYVGVLAAWVVVTFLHLWLDWRRVRQGKLPPRKLDN